MKDGMTQATLAIVVVAGIIGTLILAISQTNLTSTSTSTSSISNGNSVFTTLTGSGTFASISISACNTEPNVLNILPSVMALPQVISAEGNYSNWVEVAISNQSGTAYNIQSGYHAFYNTQINIDSLKPNAPSQCYPPNSYVNSQLALLVPIVNGQYNVSGTQAVQVELFGGPKVYNTTLVPSNTSTISTSIVTQG